MVDLIFGLGPDFAPVLVIFSGFYPWTRSSPKKTSGIPKTEMGSAFSKPGRRF